MLTPVTATIIIVLAFLGIALQIAIMREVSPWSIESLLFGLFTLSVTASFLLAFAGKRITK